VLALLLVAIAFGSTQTSLFDAGPRDGVAGLRVSDTGWIAAAADFELSKDLPVTGAEIWTTEFPGMFAWSGTVNYYVLADSGGSPTGPLLYSGTGTSVTREADPFADCCGYDEFKYSLEFDPQIELQAGVRYWLAINIPGGGTFQTTQAFWASTSTHFGSGARVTADPTFSSWAAYDTFDLAFRLLGTASDTTPPTLTVPAVVTADATSPDGGVVDYGVTANDEADPNPTVACVPRSGSEFAIGDTTVRCTATDASTNTATAKFVVHVRGAAEQLANLTATVDAYKPRKLGASLLDKLATAQRFLGADKPQQACANINSFLAEVESQSGTGLSQDQAAYLTSSADRIESVIAC
jgi:hypothetical protein